MPREQWSGRAAFVLATVASAVGLGNVWRFSYVAGENGGGAFLLAYLAAVAVLGLQLMVAEFALGRRARADIVYGLAAYSLTLGGARAGLAFLFAPDLAALARPQVWLADFGQAFFSLGVGVGTLATYGSYAPGEAGLTRSALLVAGIDTSFALVAGLAIFPAVFAFGLDPGHGPALAFVTLPQVFAVMPGGAWVGLAFFALLAFAALSPTIALIEVPVAALMKARGWSRAHAIAAANLSPGLHASAWRGLLRMVVPAVLAAVFAGSALMG